MTREGIIKQLESLRESQRASAEPDDPTDVFTADVEALDAAIGALSCSGVQQELKQIRRRQDWCGFLMAVGLLSIALLVGRYGAYTHRLAELLVEAIKILKGGV